MRKAFRTFLIRCGLLDPAPRTFPRELICARKAEEVDGSAMTSETPQGGWRSYAGTLMQRKWSDIFTIEVLLVEVRPKLIIELGTGSGAFSSYLATYSYLNGASFFTVDLHIKGDPQRGKNPRTLKFIEKCGGTYANADIFCAEFLASVRTWIGGCQPGEAFIYCDGGDKAREIAVFSELLRPGDWIAVHDYESEIFPKDVAPLIASGRIEPWNESLFLNNNSSNRAFTIA
ncbi:MAG: hypothetical protein EPN26_03635 [Rhodospirillales bacterium]|nr:MAG: hypothetical protein EPN26_03635 [Rhodospirillales bacterium]